MAAETSVRVRIRIGDVGIIRGVKPGEDVRGLVSARWAGQWSRPIEGSFFEVEVGELWRDYAGVDAGFQEPHGGGVAQYVGVTFFSPMLGH